MRKISSFNFVTLNGYFKGNNEDTSWHHHSQEGSAYSEKQLESGNILLFGRVTYDMMAQFWTGKMGKELYPVVAGRMNAAEKMVISNSITTASWNNTSVIGGDVIQRIRIIKQTPGPDITILGSGSIVNQFTEAGLIDEYGVMIDPVFITTGTPLVHGISTMPELRLTGVKTFSDTGAVLLSYSKK
ncbi:MAG TPA: dihydrofolate reductase family protein [Bacteroidia bacterium]|nr:dihydrofolate reductase family protein [Bacteroidia bacterium]